MPEGPLIDGVDKIIAFLRDLFLKLWAALADGLKEVRTDLHEMKLAFLILLGLFVLSLIVNAIRGK